MLQINARRRSFGGIGPRTLEVLELAPPEAWRQSGLEKVRDRCHFTPQVDGSHKLRGAACSACNAKMKDPKDIIVLFHNGEGFDFHYLVRGHIRACGEAMEEELERVRVDFTA